MRVLFLVGTLGTGGSERFVTRMALRARQGSELDPVVCCVAGKQGGFLPVLEQAGVEVREAPAGWRRKPGALLRFSRLLREFRPDVVHSQVNFSLGQQLLAVRVATRAPFCVTERSCYRFDGAARLRRIVQFHLLRCFGVRYSANGTAVADHVARTALARADSIPVLPNGVPMIPADPETRARMRALLGWGPDDFGIGYVGRLIAEKGHAEFFGALAELRSQGLRAKACLLGDGPHRAEVERLAVESGLGPDVMLAGTVSNVEEYLQAFDTVALFSSREGMPNALLEAMAAGKPIAATAVGAVAELLDDGRAGVLVRGREPSDLAGALRSLLCDEELRTRLGERAAERCRSLFSVDACYSRLLSHYGEVARS